MGSHGKHVLAGSTEAVRRPPPSRPIPVVFVSIQSPRSKQERRHQEEAKVIAKRLSNDNPSRLETLWEVLVRTASLSTHTMTLCE